jgi:hypothetical protein
MKEKNYYPDISRYYRKHATNCIAWESKLSKTDRISFTALAPHQEDALLQAERVYGEKIADVGILKKGFDGFILYKATSLFIGIYFKPSQTEIYEIPIRSFLNEKYTSKEKSLTKKRASEIGRLIHI